MYQPPKAYIHTFCHFVEKKKGGGGWREQAVHLVQADHLSRSFGVCDIQIMAYLF